MAKQLRNVSEFTVYIAVGTESAAVAPGGLFPAGVTGTNPLVFGDTDGDALDDEGGGEGPPPQSGKGSGEAKWREYAEEQGVDVSDVEGRDGIIAALEEAGVAVE